MKTEKIYFTLDKRIPETLYAEYNGRIEKVALMLVPANLQASMENKPLLNEETVINAMKFLMTLVDFDSGHFVKLKWYQKLWRIIIK